MRVLIDARVPEGLFGGMQQTIMGLAEGLRQLDAHDDFVFLTLPGQTWLDDSLGGRCTKVEARFPTEAQERVIAAAPGGANSIPGKVVTYLLETRGRVLPVADPAVERIRPDVIHFMRQRGFRTDVPNIYQPHDLQHVHLPEYYHPLTRVYRRVVYRAMADQADLVSVMSSSGVDEVVTHLGVPRERVVVVPWAPVNTDDATAAPVRPAGVPDGPFAYFPALTWPHKNHLRLVAALRILRDNGVTVPLVLTGKTTPYWDTVVDRARRAGVADLLHQLGYVTREEVAWLYRNARMLVFPSRYEGWGLPVIEAMQSRLPVAASDIAPLSGITGGTAVLFDPEDEVSMADAIGRLWGDHELRATLAEAAVARVAQFSWRHTASLFRAHYHALGGVADDADRDLLTARPLV